MINLEKIKSRREKSKEMVKSYCLKNKIDLEEKTMKSGMTSVVLCGRAFHSNIEQNAWVFALSFLELELKAKFDY